MKGKRLLWIIGVTVALFLLLFGTLKPSPIHKFPIPLFAQLEAEHSKHSKSYRFYGINTLYEQHVKLFGWKEIDRLGSKGIYEKNGNTVSIITYKNGFQLIANE
ncbi:hypothetical protein SAMN05216389_101354 [Oceanobacillus limi]|uniref:Uncharacterized protein n=1 Tax=Oceanobacillus limi TaxID=930131 RepID=A0A1H9YES5_9BACI|nr:hypothetical protein [Oceanobacillus limi]SES67375.1 hypothetical protein SAMN05216389_101354 [Oceanobacillus limi]